MKKTISIVGIILLALLATVSVTTTLSAYQIPCGGLDCPGSVTCTYGGYTANCAVVCYKGMATKCWSLR